MGKRMKVGTLVNFIPPHNKPIPLIQGLIVDIVEKFHSKSATKPTTHYRVQWFSGVDYEENFEGLFLPCQLEIAK